MVIITLLLGVVSDYFGGVFISLLWNWFIASAFHLPMISWVVGMGIMFIHDILGAFSASLDAIKKEHDSDDVLRAWLLTAFAWVVTMIIAFVIHIIIK